MDSLENSSENLISYSIEWADNSWTFFNLIFWKLILID